MISENEFCPLCNKQNCNIIINDEIFCRFTKEKTILTNKSGLSYSYSNRRPYFNCSDVDRKLYASFIIFLKTTMPELTNIEMCNYAKRYLLMINTWDEFDEKDFKKKKFEFLIDIFINKYSIPVEYKSDIMNLYDQVIDDEFYNKTSIYILCTSMCYVICRSNGFPLSLTKMTDYFKIKRKTINRFIIALKEKIEIKFKLNDYTPIIKQFCNDLSINDEITNKIVEDYNILKEKGYIIDNKKPNGVIAALIYKETLFTDCKMSQNHISAHLNTNSVSLRLRLLEILKILEPEDNNVKKEQDS